MIQQWLIASYPWAVAQTWVSDDFSGGSIDTSKWTVQQGSWSITIDTWRLKYTRPWSGTNCNLFSVSTRNTWIVFIQCNMDFVNASWTNGDLFWMFITSSSTLTTATNNPPNYSAYIHSRTDTLWKVRVNLFTTSTQYWFDTAIADPQDFKITYNISNNQTKYWYWSGSAWTQMWTTQTVNILNWWSLYGAIIGANHIDNVYPAYVDNLYFWTIATDYTTQYPV